ncbi:TadE family type IV pilus minor pilin [Pseudonocardia nantongensis]|uniref:TadE family type IV pilus minor pilin n=1 Tax=Pseudonocardia nantongensis TaxID=1181885 RepID=UPI00397A0F57
MRCPRRSERARADDGAVTVEAALALGTLVLVAAAAVAAVAAVAGSVRCTDAARELVRQAARGDADRGRVAAATLAPTGADTELRFDGDTVVATVTARPAWPLPIRITGSATAVTEPGLTAGGAPAPAGGTDRAGGSDARADEPPGAGGAEARPDDELPGDPSVPPADDLPGGPAASGAAVDGAASGLPAAPRPVPPGTAPPRAVASVPEPADRGGRPAAAPGSRR